MFAGHINETLARTLYRAGLYVSHKDDSRNQAVRAREVRALMAFFHVLERQHDTDHYSEHFLHTLAVTAKEEMQSFVELSSEAVEALSSHLETVPGEIEEAVSVAIAEYPKEEARLYADMLITSAASVAQAHDERDHSTLWDRIMMGLANFGKDPAAKYLYEADDLFDHLKISDTEAAVLDEITASIRKVWMSNFPEDRDALPTDKV